MAAAVAEMSMGMSAEAVESKDVRGPSPTSRTAIVQASTLTHATNLPPYRVLDGREFEMYRLLGKGRSIPEIAFYFTLSPAVASKRLRIIQAKLNCRTHRDLKREASLWVLERE